MRAAAGRLDVVAITDHDEIAGGVRARDFAREHPELGVDVVVGEEISTLNGHLLGLYLSERVPPGLDLPAAVVLLASAPRARTLRAGRVPGVMGVLPGGRFVPS